MTQQKRRAHNGPGEMAAPRAPRFNSEECPLGWLASRKDKDGQPLITREQHEAGERLRRDYTFAMLMPRVTASWSAAPVAGARGGRGSTADLSDNVAAARERVNRALAAVGPELASILVDVCCHLKGLATVEKSEGWPQRSSKIVLGIALQQLARHYGMLREEMPSGVASRIRHWGADGYRPSSSAEGPDEPAQR